MILHLTPSSPKLPLPLRLYDQIFGHIFSSSLQAVMIMKLQVTKRHWISPPAQKLLASYKKPWWHTELRLFSSLSEVFLLCTAIIIPLRTQKTKTGYFLRYWVSCISVTKDLQESLLKKFLQNLLSKISWRRGLESPMFFCDPTYLWDSVITLTFDWVGGWTSYCILRIIWNIRADL